MQGRILPAGRFAARQFPRSRPGTRVGMKAMSVLAVGLLLAGCKLIDQTTFAPSPEAPTTEAVAPPKVDPRTPLVTIDYGGPPPDYLGLLRFAVHAAETRAPGVEYDVIGMLPAELQQITTYSAGITASAKQADAARALIQALTGPSAKPIFKAKGLDPL